jgi:hypothetical protein
LASRSVTGASFIFGFGFENFATGSTAAAREDQSHLAGDKEHQPLNATQKA